MMTPDTNQLPELQIRAARLDDVQAVYRIWREGFASIMGLHVPDEEAAIEIFTYRISKPTGKSRLWVAVFNGCVAGWQSLMDLGIGEMSPIVQSSTYIDARFQGMGVGRQLLRHAQSEASLLGLQNIVGWIKTDNHSSCKLVTSLGWTFVGLLPRSSPDLPGWGYWAYAVPER